MGIAELVQKYESDKPFYTSEQYNEAQLRSDFLDPLFELLGWDLHNRAGKSRSEREVIIEEPLHSSSEHVKKPDYTFKLYSERRFFVEAKKPSVNLITSDSPAKQVRRYGYTANLRISVLSNFEDLLIYDTTIPVKESDTSAIARLKSFHYTDFEAQFDEICSLIGRDAVYSGSFDTTWAASVASLDTIDSFFVRQINKWRILLGEEIIKHKKPTPEVETLNDTVQSYINEILFLRVCEDREIEQYQALLKIASKESFDKLIAKFKKADARYNSGLFKHPEANAIIKDFGSSFWTIIKELYYPESPYSFNVLPSDILGQIYESFLTKQLSVEKKTISLQDKPDVERDIVSTPTYVIRSILEKTVIPKCSQKSIDDILKMSFADIACGSGSFLLELYQLISDIIIDKLLDDDKDKLIQIGLDDYKLPFELKKRILVSCIYGVDKDFNAVEATKFDLLLKLLEDEDASTLIGKEPILPDLKDNIIFGNSLIDENDVASDDDALVINPYSFGDTRFDVIVGNPPYMKSADMLKYYPKEIQYYKKYQVANKQFDKYYLFVERAYNLLKEGGVLGYLVPSKFMKVGAAIELRRFIKNKNALKSITSFGANQLFDSKTTYTCILVLSKDQNSSFDYDEVRNLTSWKLSGATSTDSESKAIASLQDECWILYPKSLSSVYSSIYNNAIALKDLVGESNIFNGIQTSANKIYVIKPEKDDGNYLTFKTGDKKYVIEKAITKPYFSTEDGDDSLNTYRSVSPNARVIFPYRKTKKGITLIPLNTIKKKYPKLYLYLQKHKAVLEKRDIQPKPKSKNEWYQFGRQQGLDSYDVPQKIIVGVLSGGDKYAIDTQRTVVTSGGTAGYCLIAVPKDSQYSIYYIQAVLNSKYTEWICSLSGEVFRGGYIARGTKVLNRLPIKKIDFNDKTQVDLHNDIVEFQKQLIKYGDILAKTEAGDRNNIKYTRSFNKVKNKLDAKLSELYGLGDDDSLVPSIKELYAIY